MTMRINNDKLIKLQRDWFPAVPIKSTRRNRKIPPKKSNYTRNKTGHTMVISFCGNCQFSEESYFGHVGRRGAVVDKDRLARFSGQGKDYNQFWSGNCETSLPRVLCQNTAALRPNADSDRSTERSLYLVRYPVGEDFRRFCFHYQNRGWKGHGKGNRNK